MTSICFAVGKFITQAQMEKVLGWKLDKYSLFTHFLVGWNLENLYNYTVCCVNFFHISWRFKQGKFVFRKAYFLALHLRCFMVLHLAISLISSSLIHLVDFLDPPINFYFLHLNLILKLMVAGLLLLLHLLFGMHFHLNLDLVIPFLLLNLSSRLFKIGYDVVV